MLIRPASTLSLTIKPHIMIPTKSNTIMGTIGVMPNSSTSSKATIS